MRFPNARTERTIAMGLLCVKNSTVPIFAPSTYTATGGVTVKSFPAETCVQCDLPWKNNRVCYDGNRRWIGTNRELALGSMLVRVDENGSVTGTGPDGEKLFCYETGVPVRDGTLAFDSLYHVLYFAAGRGLTALSLDDGEILFRVSTPGEAGSPTLFEWLLPTGDMQLAVGFGEDAGSYVVCDRLSGALLWRAQTLGAVADAAAHYMGYLYMTLRGAPSHALFRVAMDGHLGLGNRGRAEANGGVVCEDAYCVLGKSGAWDLFSLINGERLS